MQGFRGTASGSHRTQVVELARAGTVVGLAGLFLEGHQTLHKQNAMVPVLTPRAAGTISCPGQSSG